MKFTEMQIPGVFLLEPTIHRDDRGYFIETHRAEKLGDATKAQVRFVQGNFSSSMPWTLRGLHYQLQEPQGKLVRCVTGMIWDVAVDLRRGSPTFGKYVASVLDEEFGRALWVPPGFAHGFLSLGQPAKVQYECTTEYVEAWNRVLLWNDPALGIRWPLQQGQTPRMSNKDRAGKPLAEAEVYEKGWQGVGFDKDFDVGALQKLRKASP